jgi:hypothetical protein
MEESLKSTELIKTTEISEVSEVPGSESSESSVSEPVEVKMHDIDKEYYGKEGYPELPDIRTINNTKDTFGLEDELNEEEMKQVLEIVENNLKESNSFSEDVNLDEDSVKIHEQNFAVISFIGPTLTAKTEKYGLRIMGIFDTIEEASDHIEEFEEDEKMFDTVVAELYKFLPSYPSFAKESQKDIDKLLNEKIINYKREREIAKIKFETRKNKLMSNKDRYIEKNEPPPIEKIKEITNVDNIKEVEPVPRNKTHARLLEKLEARKNGGKSGKNDEKGEREMDKKESKKLSIKKCSTRVDGQNFVAICFVGHNGENKRVAMKIKGAFATYEECEKHCKELMSKDDTYDIFVSEMYSWIPCDPDVDKVEQVHSDEKLNEMFSANKEESGLTNKFHMDRKKMSKDEVMKLMNNEKDSGEDVGKGEELEISNHSNHFTASSILSSMEEKDPINYKNN